MATRRTTKRLGYGFHPIGRVRRSPQAIHLEIEESTPGFRTLKTSLKTAPCPRP